jgi:hypothetical protein
MLESRYTVHTVYEKIYDDFVAESFQLVGYYKGFLQAVSGNEQFEKGKGGENVTHRFYTGLRTPCQYGYLIESGASKFIMLYTLQHNGISGTGHHKEILCGAFQ